MLKLASAWMALNPRKHQFRPQTAGRSVAQGKAAAIEPGEIDDDRQPEPGPGLGLARPLPPPRDLRALGRRQAAAVVVDDDSQPRPRTGRRGCLDQDLDEDLRRRPFAGVVDEIA